MRVLVVGGGAREHAIAATLHQAGAEVLVAAANANPGLDRLARSVVRLDPNDPTAVTAFAAREHPHFAVIGPEAPLASGVADALRAREIPVVGPSRAAARIETSKEFMRALLAKYEIDAQPRYRYVAPDTDLLTAMNAWEGPLVVKPVGLSAGKGVWVEGADFTTLEEATTYVAGLLARSKDGVLLEERVDGEEFSLMAFVTDSGVYPMPVVQDYKRALEGDRGANTGGMGAVSQRDHLLPFLPRADYDRAVDILRRTVEALHREGLEYRGILYGGFMLTARGPVLLEFNARFGDPEGINVLALYEEGNFEELLYGVATGRVDPVLVRFRLRATVTKYLVPPGYPAAGPPDGPLSVDEPAINAKGVRIYYGSVEAAGPNDVRLTSSRGIALVGEASAIHEAASRVESALPFVKGAYYVRHDIGKKEDIAKRVEHMRGLFVPGAKPSPLPLSVAPADAPPSSAAGPSQVLS